MLRRNIVITITHKIVSRTFRPIVPNLAAVNLFHTRIDIVLLFILIIQNRHALHLNSRYSRPTVCVLVIEQSVLQPPRTEVGCHEVIIRTISQFGNLIIIGLWRCIILHLGSGITALGVIVFIRFWSWIIIIVFIINLTILIVPDYISLIHLIIIIHWH